MPADREAIRANARAFLDRWLPFAYSVASDNELRHLGATIDDPFLAAELAKRGLQIATLVQDLRLPSPRQRGEGNIARVTDFIYHYTSLDTFLKIVENRELWATDLRCLNDATETTYGINGVIEQLDEHVGQIRRERPAVRSRTAEGDARIDYLEDDPNYWADLVLQAKDTLQRRSEDGVLRLLAVCFSGQPDALSQWRAYGGRGCAIGFEPDPDAIIRDRQTFHVPHKLTKLEYGEAEVARVARDIADKINDTTTTSSEDMNYSQPSYRLVDDALTRIYTFKDDGFEEEEETRLVLSRPLDSAVSEFQERMRYYVTATGLLVPYLPVPIDLSSIKEVWVGPGPHRDENVRALEIYQGTQTYRQDRDDAYEPTIIPSEIPYR